MPILDDPGAEEKSDGGILSRFSERYMATFRHLKVIPLETPSLYRACVDLLNLA